MAEGAIKKWDPTFDLEASQPETRKWIQIAQKYDGSGLENLNEDLKDRVFLVGYQLSAADVALAAAMKNDFSKRAKGKKTDVYSKYPNVCRWFDFVQHQLPEVLGNMVDLKQDVPVQKKAPPKKNKTNSKGPAKKAEAGKPETKPPKEGQKLTKKQKKQAKKNKKKQIGNLTDHLDDIDWLQYRIKRFEEIYAEQQAAKAAASGQIVVTLPDGKEMEGIKGGTSPMDIAKKISVGLAKRIVIARVTSDDHPDGKLWDLPRPLESNCKLELLDFDSEEGTETFWHSSSHVLGQSLERLYKGKLTKGPPLTRDLQLSQGGFYYDVALDDNVVVSEADYKSIEKLVLKKITCGKGQEFQRISLSKPQALDMFQENPFKQEIIQNRIPDGAEISAYRCGPLIDLCRGPHIPHTGMIKAFKVVKNSASNWDNKADGATLQRVYGITFPDKQRMKTWEADRKKAQESDHRTKGQDLKLFFFDDLSPGCCFWLPHGTRVFNALLALMRSEYRKRGYDEVVTPNMYSLKLWEISGHAAKYREDMFLLNVEDTEFALKPMNCPGHCVMFRRFQRSYRDLPIRMADFGVLHRNEASGALTGLTRVRRFQQDDAHIFCRQDQVESEIEGCLDFLEHIYGIFGFKFELALSTRNPDSMIGTHELWDKAEKALENALNKFVNARDSISAWKINEGDGAFYGPKIDIEVFDCMGRKHQCATVQLDYSLPTRFQLEYTNAENGKDQPVMIHRALLGSLERFTAILIEHCGGKLPLWISPRQVMIVPVSMDEKIVEFCKGLHGELSGYDFYVDFDESNDRFSNKYRKAQKAAYNVMLIIGANEVENNSITARKNRSNDDEKMSREDFLQWLRDARDKRQCEW